MPPMWKPPQSGQPVTPPEEDSLPFRGSLGEPIRKWRCGKCRAIHQYMPRDRKCRNAVCGSYNTLYEMKKTHAKDVD